jgi:hypothetical protein
VVLGEGARSWIEEDIAVVAGYGGVGGGAVGDFHLWCRMVFWYPTLVAGVARSRSFGSAEVRFAQDDNG